MRVCSRSTSISALANGVGKLLYPICSNTTRTGRNPGQEGENLDAGTRWDNPGKTGTVGNYAKVYERNFRQLYNYYSCGINNWTLRIASGASCCNTTIIIIFQIFEWDIMNIILLCLTFTVFIFAVRLIGNPPHFRTIWEELYA